MIQQRQPGVRESNNSVAEWYGFQVWPGNAVDDSTAALRFQTDENCPFISAVTETTAPCAKQARSGLCTVSSNSNGRRQNWLACPYRIYDTHFTLLRAVVHRLYAVSAN